MKSVSMKRISMKRVSAGDHLTNLLFYALLGVFVVICFYPIWYVLVASISDPTYVNSGALITLPEASTSPPTSTPLTSPSCGSATATRCATRSWARCSACACASPAAMRSPGGICPSAG